MQRLRRAVRREDQHFCITRGSGWSIDRRDFYSVDSFTNAIINAFAWSDLPWLARKLYPVLKAHEFIEGGESEAALSTTTGDPKS